MTVETKDFSVRAKQGRLTVKGPLALTSSADRRRAAIVVLFGTVSAATSALMVWSIAPFMELLFDPTAMTDNRFLSYVSRTLGISDPYQLFLFSGGLCLLSMVSVFVAQLIGTRAVSQFSAGMVHGLSMRLLSSYMKQPYEFFLDRHRSDLNANILSETEAVVGQFFKPVLQLAVSCVTTLAVVAVVATVNATAMLFLGGGILTIYGLVYLAIRGQIRRLGKERVEANRRRFREASDGLQSIKDVKILGLEEPFLARFSASSLDLQGATVQSQLFSSVPGFALRAVLLGGGIIFLVSYVDRSAFLQNNALDGIAPALGALAVAAQRLLPELQRILESVLRLQYGRAALERIKTDLANLSSPDAERSADRIRLLKELTLQNVTYAYPGNDRLGLEHISLTIRAGEKVGLVGRSGAGKTTLGDVVLGLLVPTAGDLLVDGVPITRQNRSGWRLGVGFVPQDIFLKDASVTENIALGVSPDDIDMDRVFESARVAHIKDYVTQQLPLGFDTMIGERGVRLSGGQRQRLAIARALYRDADLIVFDEATSALDNSTEQEVMDALHDISGRKSILIIAHRMTTLNVCDRIVVLESGRIAGVGTSAELEKSCKAYQDLLSSERMKDQVS